MLHVHELFRFMGIDESTVPWRSECISAGEMGFMLGNSVCLPVMKYVLAHALFASGLLSKTHVAGFL